MKAITLKKNISFCIPFLLLYCLFAASTVNKTFELGFNYKVKKGIIKDYLSENGSIYSLRAGTIFVIDTPEVMKRIENFLNDKNISKVKQAVIYLKNLDSLNSKISASQIDFKIDSRKGVEIEMKGYNQNSKKNDSRTTQIMIISGVESAIAIKKSREDLEIYRGMFLQVHSKKRVIDGVALKVKAFISKHGVKVRLRTEYWAKVDNIRETYATRELETQIFVPYGKWQDIGGSESSHVETTNTNGILKNEKKEIHSSSQIMIKASRVKM
jgi:hypothetical protein